MRPFFEPDYPYWRVLGDGVWHRIKSYRFHYAEARNENVTYCGLTLNNPEFVDITPWARGEDRVFRPEPDPMCTTCAREYPREMQRRALREAEWWGRRR